MGRAAIRADLYSLTAEGSTSLVPDGVRFARSGDGKFVELAIDKAKIDDSIAISTLIDLNAEGRLNRIRLPSR